MNFSKEGATSAKVHQVEPKNKKSLSLDIHSHGSTFKGVTGSKKMILPINCIIVANVDGLE